VAKYMGKALENQNLPPRFRHFRRSNGWPKMPEMSSPDGWVFFKVDTHISETDEVAAYQNMGFQVIIADESAAWDWIKNYG